MCMAKLKVNPIEASDSIKMSCYLRQQLRMLITAQAQPTGQIKTKILSIHSMFVHGLIWSAFHSSDWTIHTDWDSTRKYIGMLASIVIF